LNRGVLKDFGKFLKASGQYCKLILLFTLPYTVSIGKDASNVKVCRYSQVSNDFEEIPT
jgi:hypothetical protein